MIAARLDSGIFQLIGDVCSRQPETFGKSATAFKTVRCDVAQPLPEQIGTQRRLLCLETHGRKANQKPRGHNLSGRHDREQYQNMESDP